MKTHQILSSLTLVLLGMGSEAVAQQSQDVTSEEIVVTGTRDVTRTRFTSLAPVDVLSERAVQETVTGQVHEILAQLAPSFAVQKLPTSDGLQFVRPATLRNLSPDQTLVLINGRRFHRSAFLGSRGAQAPDLAQIPASAIERIEVLRDGASAQYGSDAIAGVINIILSDDAGYAAFGQYSQYAEDDGDTRRAGVRGGWEFDNGHVTLTGEYSNADLTSRTNQRADAIAFQTANPSINVPNPVQRWGQPELESARFALDSAFNLGLGEAYAFGAYGKTNGINDINWRNPSTNASIFKTTAVFPGFDLRTIYPAGFTPREGIKAEDVQAVFGLRGGDQFSWDFSASYGRNASSFFLIESINASLGPNSPFEFDLGELVQREINLNADFVYRWDVSAFAQPVNVAFGLERRNEQYEIHAGDPASYAVGPGAAAGLAPNSNGFPGFSDRQAGDWDQTSNAAYVDVEVPLLDRLTIGGALRYEDFSEFGDTLDGKLSGRFEFTPDFALRASFSTGFRAPTPGQLNATSVSQGLNTTTLQLFTTGRVAPSSVGAAELQPEESETMTAGLVFRHGAFSASLDAYRIDLTDRFSQSASIAVTPAIIAQLTAAGVSGASTFTSISYFTNDFDTRTEGVDAVLGHASEVGPGDLSLSVAYNYNQTEVTAGALSTNPNQKRTFEEGRPQHNATASATYDVGQFSLLGRMRYYGEWTDQTDTTGVDRVFQEFEPITFWDASITYHANEHLDLRVGAENIFDTYPDKAKFQASRGLVYSRNAPYDSYGAQFYVRLDTRF